MDDELIAVLEDGDEELNAELSEDVIYLGSGGGTSDYNELENKPTINGVVIEGDKTSDDYKISATYTDKEGSTEAIGGWSVGETADKMSVQDVLYKLLHKYYSPTLSFSILPITTMYDVGTTVSSLTFTINVTKKTNPIQSIKIYIGNEMVSEITENVENGGKFTYDASCEITDTTTLKVTINDGNQDVSSSKTLTFTARSYYGFIEDTSNITADTIIGLQNSVLSNSKNLTYSNITCENQSIVYAYRSSLGNLTNIIDANGFGYLSSYTKINLTIGDIDYNVYYLTNKTSVDGFRQVFS